MERILPHSAQTDQKYIIVFMDITTKARTHEGKLPWDLAQQNHSIKSSDAFRRLKEAQF